MTHGDNNNDANNDSSEAYESLVQFLYRAPVGLVQTNLDGDIEMMNPMSAQLLMPLSADGNLENLFRVLEVVAPGLRGQIQAFDQASGTVCDALRVPLGDGSAAGKARKTMSVSLLKLDRTRLMAMLSDVTLEVEREQLGLARHLRDASRVDALTQMPNREGVKAHLAAAMAQGGGECTVLFMNCDRFKLINDALGQSVGDAVLNLIAGRLRSTLRQSGRPGGSAGGELMVARLGSDEFVVVLAQPMRPDDVLAVAQRLIDVLAKPYAIGQHQLYCSVSMGIVMGAQAAGDADAVLQDASIAMVEAKRSGGGRYVVFNPAMQALAVKRANTEAALRLALDEGQLFVVYQPVVGLHASGAIDPSAGVEALVRWQHPERGVVSPIEFIGVAEECGLIGALGDFVLGTACRQFMQWQQQLGPSAPRLLAVNLSRAQLDQPDFIASVDQLLKACNMAAHHLQLEVTESLAAQDESVQVQMHALKKLGLSLALDDFGTGYSSLSYLHHLPIHELKLDKSFVQDLATSATAQALTNTVLRIGDSLRLTVVAEGVETQLQSDFLTERGCPVLQGYLFARPLPADELERWLADRRAPAPT